MKEKCENSLERAKEEKEIYPESDVEGYGYCATGKQKCMQDCNGAPLVSTLN